MEARAQDAGQAMAKLWWLSFIRGLAALLLGVTLLVAPAQGRLLLAQYMGMYWLATSLLSIVWGLRGARFTRLWLVAGIVGILGGLLIVTHRLFAPPLALTVTTRGLPVTIAWWLSTSLSLASCRGWDISPSWMRY
jgi:uncharacterized membrane protein HdeD (DUF308 family)